MDKISEFAENAVSKITNETLKDDEKHRIIGIIAEKERLYKETGCDDEQALEMALSEAQLIEVKTNERKALRIKKDNALADVRPLYARILFVISAVEFAMLLIILIFNAIKGTLDGWTNIVPFIIDCIFAGVPMFVVTLYLKAEKNSLRNFGIGVAVFFLIISTYQLVKLFI